VGRAGDRKAPVNVMIDLPLLERLDDEATRSGATRSELIRRAVSRWLDAEQAGASQAREEVVRVADMDFTVAISKDGRWWIGSVKELPGCGTQGRTLKELREMLEDAIEGYLVVRGDLAQDA